MNVTRPVRMLALVGVVALGAAACSSSNKSGTAAPTNASGLKIGFFGALTGPDAQLGINIEDGEKLAIAQYNQTKPKTPVSIDLFDSQGDASQANNGATKLINDKVAAIIGPAFSGESAAADPILEQAQIPYVSASATNTQLAQHGWKYFHRVLADDSLQGPADANYLVNTLKMGNVAVVDDNSVYGKGLADALRGQLKKVGAKDVVDDHVDPNGADYGSTVNKIVAANAQAVFYGGYYDAAGRMIKQLRAAGFKGAFMSGDGSEDNRFVTDAGGTIGKPGSAAEGSYLSCACADVTNQSSAASFVSAYKSMFAADPAIYSAEAYDSANFVLAAIKAGNTTPKTINDFLSTKNWSGVTKTFHFLPNGNVSGGTIYEYKVENGSITEIGTSK